jgi:hypothetical protein
LGTLDVGDNDFGKKGWVAFIKSIQKHKYLETLEVSNGMDKYGWSAIYSLIVENCRIPTFVFRANKDISAGLNILADPLRIAPGLRHLDFSGCELGVRPLFRRTLLIASSSSSDCGL